MREHVPPKEVEPQPKMPEEPLMVMAELERAVLAMEPAGRRTPPLETVRPLVDWRPLAWRAPVKVDVAVVDPTFKAPEKVLVPVEVATNCPKFNCPWMVVELNMELDEA